MTLYEFQRLALTNPANSSTRYGQHLFNLLHEHKPAVAKAIRGTDSDCYYNDTRLAAFWEACEHLWD